MLLVRVGAGRIERVRSPLYFSVKLFFVDGLEWYLPHQEYIEDDSTGPDVCCTP